MTYTHGVYVYEESTSILAPITADSAIQVVVGTAPVNLLANPEGAVNKPLIAYSYAEAVAKLGYSDEFENYTLCQAIDATFRVYNVAPIVLINVLDPAVHNEDVSDSGLAIENSQVVVESEGILLDTVEITVGTSTTVYEVDSDYTAAFNSAGHLVISIVSDGNLAAEETINIAYTKLDPSAVSEDDIIGGYNAATGVYSGLENISQIYPKLGIVPGLLTAPGWSHKPEVVVAMMAKTANINGSFNCLAITDVDTSEVTTYDAVNDWKNTNGYIDKNTVVCWPLAKIGSKNYYMSALISALTAYTDALNQNVPFVSPSNKSLRISGTILIDGTEVYLDQLQANSLNAVGVLTAINVNGWKSWGNNTSIYPSSSDVKDRYIAVRRMFIWWGNSFILTYFQKVDDPMNFRLIETVVDTENIRANGYKARGQIADARIVFNVNENPVTDLLGGTIRFRQYLTSFPPAETIENVLEFDPNALLSALIGGE